MSRQSRARRAGTWRTLGALALLPLFATVTSSTCGCAGTASAARTANVEWAAVFSDDFASSAVITEATSPERSSSDRWWLESGARFVIDDGVAGTVWGEEPAGYFRQRYAERNARDTDNGVHPQNLFRLLTVESWNGNIAQTCSFRVHAYHLTKSPQRGAPNGLLLFCRYTDAYNLYYAGVRVDGHAVVKKKSAGVYYTLAEKPVFKGRFHRDSAPTMLPREEWITLRSVVADEHDGSVSVSLYRIDSRTGKASLLLKGIDAGVGGEPFRSGHGGIRTDFMDVEFDNYSVAVPK